jgi:hypothetical protein
MNFSAHRHLVHANLQEKRKAAWPLTHQWYSIHLPSTSIDGGRGAVWERWQGCRPARSIAALPLHSVNRLHERSILFTYSSGWDQSYRRTIAVLASPARLKKARLAWNCRSMAAAGLQVMLLRMRALPAHQVSDSCAT